MCFVQGMIIAIVAVGKTKKDFVKSGILEYEKRIAKYGKVVWKFVDPSENRVISKQIEEETLKVKKQLEQGVPVIALDKSGFEMNSEQLANKMKEYDRVGKIQFVIGGSHGLALPLLAPDYVLSFSKMTFEHDLIRLILLEQVFRALDINSGGEYHK